MNNTNTEAYVILIRCPPACSNIGTLLLGGSLVIEPISPTMEPSACANHHSSVMTYRPLPLLLCPACRWPKFWPRVMIDPVPFFFSRDALDTARNLHAGKQTSKNADEFAGRCTEQMLGSHRSSHPLSYCTGRCNNNQLRSQCTLPIALERYASKNQ
jgi:hypothetical protein